MKMDRNLVMISEPKGCCLGTYKGIQLALYPTSSFVGGQWESESLHESIFWSPSCSVLGFGGEPGSELSCSIMGASSC